MSVSAPGIKEPTDSGVLSNFNLTTERTRYAHVVFSKKKSVSNCLKSVERGDIDGIAVVVGKKWHNLQEKASIIVAKDILKDYQWRDCGTLDDQKADVDEHMKEFEEKKKRERLEKIRKSKEVDDDGFMPVRAKKR